MKGIDVSKWQKGLNVSNIDADFVIAKATGGSGYVDTSFGVFAHQAIESGKLFGFYHFAKDGYSELPGNKEADFFYRHTKDFCGVGLPVLDLEDNAISDWAEYASEFCTRYHDLAGIYPVVYTGLDGINALWRADLLDKVKIWFAGYPLGYIDYWLPDTANPRDYYQIKPQADIIMWQFTSAVNYDGHNVDANLCYIDSETWADLSGGNMAINDDDIARIAKACAEYVYSEEDEAAHLNMYNTAHWAYWYAHMINDKIDKLIERLDKLEEGIRNAK